MYGVNLKEEEDDLLATYQGLLKKNAEMEEKVNKADKRLIRLRTQLDETANARELLEAKHEELNEQWKDSGNGSTPTEDGSSQETDGTLDHGFPASLSPLAGENKEDD